MLAVRRRFRLRSVVMDGPTTLPEPPTPVQHAPATYEGPIPGLSFEGSTGTRSSSRTAPSTRSLVAPDLQRYHDLETGAVESTSSLWLRLRSPTGIYAYVGNEIGPAMEGQGVPARVVVSRSDLSGAEWGITACVPVYQDQTVTHAYFFTQEGEYVSRAKVDRPFYMRNGDTLNVSVTLREELSI